MTLRFVGTPIEAECTAGTFRLADQGAGAELAVHYYAVRTTEKFGEFGLFVTVSRLYRPTAHAVFQDVTPAIAASHLEQLANYLVHNYPYAKKLTGLKVTALSVAWTEELATSILRKFKERFPLIKEVEFSGAPMAGDNQ